jgi:hypothetical protein
MILMNIKKNREKYKKNKIKIFNYFKNNRYKIKKTLKYFKNNKYKIKKT